MIKSKAKRITADQLAECGTEDGHQAALFLWARDETLRAPVDLSVMYAIPNGGARGDNRRSSAIRGNLLKGTGVKKGFPDVGVPIARQRISESGSVRLNGYTVPIIVGYAGLYIELKRPASYGKAAGKLGPRQDDWAVRLRGNGYAVVTCYGWVAAAYTIRCYLAGSPMPDECVLLSGGAIELGIRWQQSGTAVQLG